MGTTKFLNNKRKKTNQNNYVAAVYRTSAKEVGMRMPVLLCIHVPAHPFTDLTPSRYSVGSLLSKLGTSNEM